MRSFPIASPNPNLARHYLKEVCHAVIKATVERPAEAKEAAWEEAMADISQVAYRAYRSLVYEMPGFVDYFTQVTRIEALMHLWIGSRPAKRQ